MSAASRDAASVIESLEDQHGERCVDFITDADGGVVFKEYRRDVEDGGRWTLVADYAAVRYASRVDALAAASARLAWLGDVMPRTR